MSCAEYQSGQTLYSVAYKDDKDLCTLSFIYMYYKTTVFQQAQTSSNGVRSSFLVLGSVNSVRLCLFELSRIKMSQAILACDKLCRVLSDCVGMC